MNKVILKGNLGKDAEHFQTSGGSWKASFSVATWNGKDKPPTWHNVVWWNSPDGIRPYLTKGREVLVEGEISYRSYEKDGLTRYITEIVAFRLYLCGGRDGGGPAQAPVSRGKYPPISADKEHPF